MTVVCEIEEHLVLSVSKDEPVSRKDDHDHAPIAFKRANSSFIRVADLEIDEFTVGSDSADSEESFPNFHHVAVDPPPGVETDPKEKWVVLDDGGGKHSPIAPTAVKALARSGIITSFDKDMWTADSKTNKLLKQYPAWNAAAWQNCGPIVLPNKGTFNEKEILVWSGTFKHGHYGSELPAIRSVAIINMNPKILTELLLDSSRVKEYNKLCAGRTDILSLQSEMDDGSFGGVTKILKTITKPPMMRKNLHFTSLMHARELEDGSGYTIVTRAVTLPEEKEDGSNAVKSEILLGATIIRSIDGDDNRCLFVSINHLRCPMVPLMIAKRIGLQAAVGFIQDLRRCCKI